MKKNRILIRKEKRGVSTRWLRDISLRLMELLQLQNTEVSIYLTGDENMRKLNREYRGKNKPTDVLSFTFEECVGDCILLGEIVISMDTARRQAEELGHSLEDEVRRLLVHGFVHLMGYDHELGGDEEKRFKELEEKLLSELCQTT